MLCLISSYYQTTTPPPTVSLSARIMDIPMGEWSMGRNAVRLFNVDDMHAELKQTAVTNRISRQRTRPQSLRQTATRFALGTRRISVAAVTGLASTLGQVLRSTYGTTQKAVLLVPMSTSFQESSRP